jgi:methionyl-tRNA synthetase
MSSIPFFVGVSPKEFFDNMVCGKGGILDLWKLMNISYDRFIRTTDDYHVKSIQKIFCFFFYKGDIYKSVYKGLYCTPCESFWPDSQLLEGKCPDCNRDVIYAEEEAYFFRQSKYADRIKAQIASYLEPQSRVNEMMNNFLIPGLEDICVSRTSFSWGIPVDFDPGHVVYVWVDALSNYITALGFFNDEYNDFDKYWPCDVHFVGKEIVRLHSILWQSLLMALDVPLPKKVYGHGWLLLGDVRMAKSRGNVIDPALLASSYGVDALRYFLLRDFSFGTDGNFSVDILVSRINADLANDFGNLVSRTIAMIDKYFAGVLPCGFESSVHESDSTDTATLDAELISMAGDLQKVYSEHMEKFAFQDALREVLRVSSRANKYIDETAPWVLAKDENNKARLATVLYNLLETIRICTVLLSPVMPDACALVFEQIGVSGQLTEFDSTLSFGAIPSEHRVKKGDIVFPRFELIKEA